jgi:hypothetical protein
MLVLPALISCERPADRAEAVVKPTDGTWKEIPVDDRLPIAVDAATRQAVLAEMRTLLNAVRGVVSGVASWDTSAIRNSARSAGVAAASEAEPAVQAQLGAAFVQVGMRTHHSFDSLATDAGKSREVVLMRLATVMDNCVGCHNQWRLVIQP